MKKFVELVSYILHDRFRVPFRLRRWKRKKKSFLHTGANAIKFELDPREYIDSWIFADGIYERRYLELLRLGLGRKRVFIDVGANIGNHALYLQDQFEQVHCFEPNPEAAKRLRRNLSLNAVSNITIHEIGLGEKSDLLPFSPAAPGSLGQGSFISSGEGEQLVLRVRDGDGYLAEQGIRGIDFIKIDVEGFERQVLRGLTETIKAERPIVAFEYHGHLEPPESFDEIAALLPDYVFVDPVPPAPSGHLAKIRFGLRHGMRPQMRVISAPERRPYLVILGFPSSESANEFIGKSDA